ncbi:MAG: methenyltetrahydromethanopterin cyclohydrolase, partial [Candidatus Bathyarchaeia archaeon]
MDGAVSVNRMAWQLAEQLLSNKDFYGVNVSKSTAGATIIDAGVCASGGFQAGLILTELCMGGCGRAHVDFKSYSDVALPSITVCTDRPAIAALGSQFAGWRIKEAGGSIAIGSGPARALALKPKEIYEEIAYRDSSDKAVLTLESNVLPSDMLIEKVTGACNIKPE